MNWKGIEVSLFLDIMQHILWQLLWFWDNLSVPGLITSHFVGGS